MQPIITIFTPTYNRVHTLPRLCESLNRQSNKNFEWIIVDDGSTDDTMLVVENYKREMNFSITYYLQQNAGKHIGINKGLELASGELFFIVDSDDWLKEDAVERILFHYSQIRDNSLLGGVCGLKVFENGEKVGGECNFGTLECNSLDFRYKYHIRGDMAEVFKTSVLKTYKFPTTYGEKFCPEALIWNRIAMKYKLRYFYERIYFCEYMPDGLTAKITKLRILNPINTCMHYAELAQMPIPLLQKLKSQINYWRFSFYLENSFVKKIKQIGYSALLMYPLGFVFFLTDKKK